MTTAFPSSLSQPPVVRGSQLRPQMASGSWVMLRARSHSLKRNETQGPGEVLFGLMGASGGLGGWPLSWYLFASLLAGICSKWAHVPGLL